MPVVALWQGTSPLEFPTADTDDRAGIWAGLGYDDILIASHTVPALTTVRMPISEIVSHAVAHAIALARDPNAVRGPSLEVFKPTLIVRDSTAPPAADR